jgi:hypothetical protein
MSLSFVKSVIRSMDTCGVEGYDPTDIATLKGVLIARLKEAEDE